MLLAFIFAVSMGAQTAAGPVVQCPAGAAWDGEKCALKAVHCPGGAVWDGHACTATTVKCAGDTSWNGTACVVVKPQVPQGRKAGETRPESRTGSVWVWMPKGRFNFGCEPQDANCAYDEKPGVDRYVDGFWMQQTEVTAAAFQACKASGACPKDQGDGEGNEPVADVDWHAAQAFCTWIGGRLPTAVEWEYAAKSGGSRIYPWGDTPPTADHAACFKCGNRPIGSRPVGVAVNGDTMWGLKDMAGSVSEWTWSVGTEAPEQQVRGGSWLAHPEAVRASHRQTYEPTYRNEMGFRCAW